MVNFVGGEIWDPQNDACGGPGDYPGTSTNCYPSYLPFTDWLSHDAYPVNWGGVPLDRPARTADKLRRWSSKPQLVYVEASPRIYRPDSIGPMADELRAEIWLAIVHGARGIVYFVSSDCSAGPCMTADGSVPEVDAEMTVQNQRIAGLAPILQSQINPPWLGFTGGSVPPLEATWRQYGGHDYLIVLNSSAGTVTQHMVFVGLDMSTNQLSVIGENRNIAIDDGQFTDTFHAYEVHVYSD